MLEWFMKNYRKHNKTPIVFANFGVSAEMNAQLGMMGFDEIINMPIQKGQGWFYKPKAILEALNLYKEICWIDTDIHILDDMTGIFEYIKPNKLTMCEDRGWSTRRGEKWHNSGVVACARTPNVLREWEKECTNNPQVGDQEVLHEMVRVSPMTRMMHIEDAPNIYNWLRLDILDGKDNQSKKAMHWTGYKGKLHIRKLMYNE